MEYKNVQALSRKTLGTYFQKIKTKENVNNKT